MGAYLLIGVFAICLVGLAWWTGLLARRRARGN
jgi:hypothetical protein